MFLSDHEPSVTRGSRFPRDGIEGHWPWEDKVRGQLLFGKLLRRTLRQGRILFWFPSPHLAWWDVQVYGDERASVCLSFSANSSPGVQTQTSNGGDIIPGWETGDPTCSSAGFLRRFSCLQLRATWNQKNNFSVCFAVTNLWGKVELRSYTLLALEGAWLLSVWEMAPQVCELCIFLCSMHWPLLGVSMSLQWHV